MATYRFSKGEAVRFGWNVMKSNLGFFIGLLIVVILIYIALTVPQIIAELIREDVPTLSLVLVIALRFLKLVIYLVIQMGFIKIALRFCDNEKAKFEDLFSCFPLFFKYLFGSILYELILIGGMILLVIPGIIWGIKFQFFSYFIVDKGLGPIEALKKSSVITRGTKYNLFLFNLLLVVINLLGALCLLIGLFATIPTTRVAEAFVYRKLLAQTDIQGTETLMEEANEQCGSSLKDVSMVYAGFWRRFVAYLIDGAILTFVTFIIMTIPVLVAPLLWKDPTEQTFMPEVFALATEIIIFVMWWLYFTLLESSLKKATFGKMALRIIVTDLNGNQISFGKANVRYWGKIVSTIILLIGFIMVGFTKKKQALHDIMAGTLVLRK